MSGFNNQSEGIVSKKQRQNKGLQKQRKFQKQNFEDMIDEELEIRADIQDEAWENEFNHPDYF